MAKPSRNKRSRNKFSEKVMFSILGGLIFPLVVGAILLSWENKKDKDTPEAPGERPKIVALADAKKKDSPDSGGEPPKKAVKMVAPEDAKRFVGEYCTIDLDVQSASQSKKGNIWFLNSERNFRNPNNLTVMVGETVTKELGEKRRLGAASFVGKRIRVSGTVKVYQDRPEVAINDMAQLVLVRQ